MKVRALALLSVALSSLSLTATAVTPTTMNAVVAVDGALSVQVFQVPVPGPGQVRIKVKAASVNPADWKQADRAAPGVKFIPGRDFAGIIDAVGPDVTDWHVGSEIIGFATAGAYAQYALADVTAIARKPRNLSFEEAAGIPVVGQTAWRAIVNLAGVKPGQRVLVQGGAGGVGSAAVQVAKAQGAQVVATASSRNLDFLRAIGVDQVIDYTSGRFEDQVSGVDAALNTVDAATGVRTIGVVRQGGILVSVVGEPPQDKCKAAQIRCAVPNSVKGETSAETLLNLTELAEDGKFHISVEQKLPLADAARAWAESRAGHVRGKLILVPDRVRQPVPQQIP